MRFIQSFSGILVLVLTIASQARAGVLLEPYLGYGQTAINYDSKASPGDARDAGTGFVLGGRAAYTLPMIFAGADYSLSSLNMKNTVAPTGVAAADYSATGSTLYAIVGVKVPMLQAYAGYGLMNSLTQKLSSGDATLSGSAYKVGVGYTGLPLVSLNLEYQIHNFTKLKTSSGEVDVSTSFSKMNSSSLLLSVSVPFDF